MLPKLYETVKPVPQRTQDSIGELVRFARDEVPAKVWLEEFGHAAPRHIIQRHEHHYHLHLHEYLVLGSQKTEDSAIESINRVLLNLLKRL